MVLLIHESKIFEVENGGVSRSCYVLDCGMVAFTPSDEGKKEGSPEERSMTIYRHMLDDHTEKELMAALLTHLNP